MEVKPMKCPLCGGETEAIKGGAFACLAEKCGLEFKMKDNGQAEAQNVKEGSRLETLWDWYKKTHAPKETAPEVRGEEEAEDDDL